MTTDPKPVELTDTERAALMHHIGGWKFERQGLANAEDAFMAEVSRIVAAREAAARREALLEAEDFRNSLDQMTTRHVALRARISTRLDEEGPCLDRYLGAATCDHPGCVLERDIRAALAEPGRDEEGGMLGGNPNFKHRDATVPMDGEQPGPRAKPRLRACVEAWPGCAEGEYNPACCRFPKSCSCDIYDPARVGPEDLEEGGR